MILKVSEIAKAVGSDSTSGAIVTSISTDTRTIKKGSLFIALKGANFDGHDYIEKAFEQGAVAAISHEEITSDKGEVIKVENTNKALLSLAAFYRQRFPISVVGITGSVGKTSTKEMIYSVLSKSFSTLKTEGNLNNEIGLPTTLFRLDPTFEAAVIEMGMSNFGEISRLSKTAKPDIGVITNIGVSHIENLGDREGILKAKLEMLDGVSGEYPLVLNFDDDMLSTVEYKEIFSFGIDNKSADVVAENIELHGSMSTTFDIVYKGDTYKAEIPVMGKHNVYNALAAFSVGILLEMDIADILEGIKGYQHTGMRQNIVKYSGITVIEDCYNASPDSMRASLDVLAKMECKGRRIAVLGDMLELGPYSEPMHRQIGEYAADKADIIFCYGIESKAIYRGAFAKFLEEIYYYDNKDSLAEELSQIQKEGDVVLFKASRGMKLEEVINKVYKEC